MHEYHAKALKHCVFAMFVHLFVNVKKYFVCVGCRISMEIRACLFPYFLYDKSVCLCIRMLLLQ